MAEAKLRNHLVRIYVLTVAAVLLAVLTVSLLLFLWDARAQNREVFSTLMFSFSDQLRAESGVSHSELRMLERENGLLFRLRDNGETLLYNAGDSESRGALFDKIEALSLRDGYNAASLPLTRERRISPIYAFRAGGRHYLGAVCLLPSDTGWRAVTMLQAVKGLGGGTLALFALAYALGVSLLSFMGARLITRALQPAVESRARQTRFIAAASHELRAPLAAISANAAALHAQGGAEAEAARAIERGCRRMSRLISDLLLLAATDAGRWSVKHESVELDTLLLNVYESFAPVFAREGCKLSLELPEEPLPCGTGDAERLAQVLEILLDNALSYGMGGAQKCAELSAAVQGRQIVLRVSDHGAGMTAEQKARAFERFYRADDARRDKEHFGLGLSIAQELVKLQNGTLELADTEGGGCTFRIVL